ncbi:MAG: hypothetical protein DMF93_02415 [Acidobacteria bacterium]|nr:MAG: hypothetical protein DMF93_02415 [Acidobacteriota bacterium]
MADRHKVSHTLLLADDSVTIQRVIELTFADEDVQVVAVSDGDQAIERLEAATPPDIVLADIGMPGKNGYEVAQYIRQSPKLSHIPVVLLTGAFEPVDQALAAEAGCDGVLAKPFEPQLVISRVKELLAKSHQLPASINAEVAPPLEIPAAQQAPDVPDPRATPTSPIASAAVPLDDYFDQLDAAITSRQAATPPPTPPTPVSLPGEAHVTEAAPLDSEIDWFGAAGAGSGSAATEQWDLPAPPAPEPAIDLPLAQEPPELTPFDIASFEAPAFEPPAQPSRTPNALPAVEASAAAAPSMPASAAAHTTTGGAAAVAELPTLADAFAALLASEQHDHAPAVWPSSHAAAITDDVVEQVTRLVLERLTDRAIRETVGDIVSRVAEQFVREEIAKIKSALRQDARGDMADG